MEQNDLRKAEKELLANKFAKGRNCNLFIEKNNPGAWNDSIRKHSRRTYRTALAESKRGVITFKLNLIKKTNTFFSASKANILMSMRK